MLTISTFFAAFIVVPFIICGLLIVRNARSLEKLEEKVDRLVDRHIASLHLMETLSQEVFRDDPPAEFSRAIKEFMKDSRDRRRDSMN